MSTFDAYESSVQDGEPVEIYTFECPSTTFYLTSAEQDFNLGGIVYSSTEIARGNPMEIPIGANREIIITIPIDHPLALALNNNGIPAENVLCTIKRAHRPMIETSGPVLGGSPYRQIWRGYVNGTASTGPELQLRIPSAIEEKFTVKLPTVVSGRMCSHLLYDTGCQVPRSTANRVDPFPTVVSALGTTLTISSIGGKPDSWAAYGEVVRRVDGARRSILTQVATVLTIDLPFGVLEFGDQLEVWAGCNHLVTECYSKFENVANFGGQPDMPTNNPTAPSGHGIIVQE